MPLPRRRPNTHPAAIYTFHPNNSKPENAASETVYVLNSTVRNRQREVRYTVATSNGETIIRDRAGTIVARVEWGHMRYPRITYRKNKVVKCKKWFKYSVFRLSVQTSPPV